jgi:sec-independent protein translocase protein TatC
MGDEVPDEGADDAPDPDPRDGTEPPARGDDPEPPSEGTDTNAEEATDAPDTEGAAGATDTAERDDTERDDTETETDRAGVGPDESLWADTPVPGDVSDDDDGGTADDGDAATAEDGTTEEVNAASEAGDDAEDSADGSGDADGADDTTGADGGADGSPDDDPLQPSVDVDYGTHRYTGSDEDTADGEADEAGSDADEGEDGDGSTHEHDDLSFGPPDATASEPADPESVTEEWTADDAVPAARADEAETSAAKSDGGYADGTDTAAVGGYGAPTDEEELFEGPPEDQEMPLADHIEEMVRRLGVVIVVMAVVSGIVFPFGERIINFLWYSVLVSDPVPQPRVYHPLALIMARLKVATLAGFIIALPVFVYESYQFMKPGLYPHERRYYLASVPTSLVLATVGVLFAYFLVLPALFTYFLYYSDEVTVIAFGLTETFDLMVLMLGGFAFIFQIPLFVMLAIMMGLTTRQWMADRRLYFWGAFLGLAFLFSPDPTGMAPIIVAATMVALFEGTLLLLKWTKRGRRRVPGG